MGLPANEFTCVIHRDNDNFDDLSLQNMFVTFLD